MRRVTASRAAAERGAILPIIAVFCVAMVAMAALVVDVGALLDERRQLQNGADAAALGVAQYIAATCSTGPVSPCTTGTLLTTAQGLANGNARDNAAAIDALTTSFTAKQVTVRTSTKSASGGTILPYQFGQAVTGSKGKTVHATAVATWAGLLRAKVVPLTISKCEFDKATANNSLFGAATVVYFHENNTAGTCKSGSAGTDLPGGYGWLRDNNDADSKDCNITPSVNNTVPDDTGTPGTPKSCDMSTLLNQDVLLALYGGLTGAGVNGVYTIYGFGMFHLTGYRFPTQTGGVVPCKAPNSCIGGSFVKFVANGDYGGPNLGNRITLIS